MLDCPDHTIDSTRDVRGDCECDWGYYCATSEDSTEGCTYSGGNSQYKFLYDCEDCRCLPEGHFFF